MYPVFLYVTRGYGKRRGEKDLSRVVGDPLVVVEDLEIVDAGAEQQGLTTDAEITPGEGLFEIPGAEGGIPVEHGAFETVVAQQQSAIVALLRVVVAEWDL